MSHGALLRRPSQYQVGIYFEITLQVFQPYINIIPYNQVIVLYLSRHELYMLHRFVMCFIYFVINVKLKSFHQDLFHWNFRQLFEWESHVDVTVIGSIENLTVHSLKYNCGGIYNQ